MPRPIVLIHGYSSEGQTNDDGTYAPATLAEIYGTLPSKLQSLGQTVVPVNVSRYVSLDDGVGVEDLSLSMDRVLRTQFPQLLDPNAPEDQRGFDVITHSTGALVAKNWIRRHWRTRGDDGKLQPCPLKHLVHLAGANLGSGWAHVGSSQLARFARMIQGVQRGVAVLNALELASDWTIDLHTHFLQEGQRLLDDYGVMEFCLIGSQPPPEYFIVPVRYGKEDGSDGVVRISASNLNFNYIVVEPSQSAEDIDWAEAAAEAQQAMQTPLEEDPTASAVMGKYYRVSSCSRPGKPYEENGQPLDTVRPLIPFAIPYDTSHSDALRRTGIVSGSENRDQVIPLIEQALGASTREEYDALVDVFDEETRQTYAKVAGDEHGPNIIGRLVEALRNAVDNPHGQYDKHSQLVFRIRDQHGRPVNDTSIFFNSLGGDELPTQLMSKLFEDQHKNDATPNTINFYLRTECWTDGDWRSQLDGVNGVSLEIDAIDPLTHRVLFLPLRMNIPQETLKEWIVPHQTTIVDVTLMRLPHKVTFLMEPSP